ncbi:MAG: DUF1178 family protein [Casimicrobiaceae bacterium]
MIIFDLACAGGHRFEGWFASTDDYAHQAQRQLVRCPICDVADHAKIPSARVHTGKATPPVETAVTASTAGTASGPAATPTPSARPPESLPIPAEVLQKLRAIVKAAEDVGGRFPEEARKMHYDETPPRAIRGIASREEAEALREEGIDVASLPAFLAEDPN